MNSDKAFDLFIYLPSETWSTETYPAEIFLSTCEELYACKEGILKRWAWSPILQSKHILDFHD